MRQHAGEKPMRGGGPENWRGHQGIKEMCGAVAGIQGLCNKWGILDEILPYCSHGMSRDAFDGSSHGERGGPKT